MRARRIVAVGIAAVSLGAIAMPSSAEDRLYLPKSASCGKGYKMVALPNLVSCVMVFPPKDASCLLGQRLKIDTSVLNDKCFTPLPTGQSVVTDVLCPPGERLERRVGRDRCLRRPQWAPVVASSTGDALFSAAAAHAQILLNILGATKDSLRWALGQ